MELSNVAFDIEDDLSRAMAIAAYAHAEDKDLRGRAYIGHPLAMVSRCMDDRAMMILCFLHDVIEDHPVMAGHPAIRRFPDWIQDALKAITKRRGEVYDAYISRVLADSLAKSVKLLDLEHNMDVLRLAPELKEKDVRRLRKYMWAWARLKGIYDRGARLPDFT